MNYITMKVSILAPICAIIIPVAGIAQLNDSKVLTIDKTKQFLDAADERANLEGWTIAVAIVDAGGHLIIC